MRTYLVGILTTLVVDGLVEKLAFCLVDLLICPTVEHHELTLPSASHPVVPLGRWESTRFFHRHSRLVHHFLNVLVRLVW